MTLRKAVSPGFADGLFTAERTLSLLQAAWPLAVGARLAERTEPLALQGRMLLVRVPDARWRKILHRLRREILGRLHQVAGRRAPSALGFVEAPASRPPLLSPQKEPPVATCPTPRLAPAVEAAAALIADEELRALFLEAAGRYLARAASRGAWPET